MLKCHQIAETNIIMMTGVKNFFTPVIIIIFVSAIW